jgi:hypothetical protein
MAKWIKADGNVVEVSPKNAGECFTSEELKGFVGGWIECIYVSPTQVMVINEEGKLLNLPYNAVATEAFRMAFQPTDDFIVGDALLCELGTEID